MFHRNWLILGLFGSLAMIPACAKDSDGADSRTNKAGAAKVAAHASPSATTTSSQSGDKSKLDIPGENYGAGISESETVAITDLLADPDAYAGKNVRVEGTVTDVCPKRGCWFEMAGEKPGEKMRFKVRDGLMVFPMDAKGKYAVAEGIVHARQLSLEDTRKYLEYQAREYGKDVDPAAVTEPMTVVRLNGKGAVIRDGE